MSENKQHSRWAVTATVLFYMVAALSMLIANKWVLVSTQTPLFFLLAQLLIAVVLFIVTHFLGLFTVDLKLDYKVCQQLLPMIALNVLGLSSNNYCLKYVDASFYQVARGLVLPLTVVLSILFIKATRPSLQVLVACACVTLGFFVGVVLDPPSSATPNDKRSGYIGIFFGLLSSLTTASHAIVIKRSLPAVNGDAIQLSWYSNVLSSMALIPIIWLVGEVPKVSELLAGSFYRAKQDDDMTLLARFLWGSLVTGLVGWLLSIAGVLSIKITSPITHMISSAVRGILQSALGVWVFHEIITIGRGASISSILVGSMYYTWVKNEELMEQRKREGGDSSNIVFDAGRRSTMDGNSSMHRRTNTDLEGGQTRRGEYTAIPMEEIETPSVKESKEYM